MSSLYSTCNTLWCLYPCHRCDGRPHLCLHHGPAVPPFPGRRQILVRERGVAVRLHPWAARRDSQGAPVAHLLRQRRRHWVCTGHLAINWEVGTTDSFLHICFYTTKSLQCMQRLCIRKNNMRGPDVVKFPKIPHILMKFTRHRAC